MADKVLKTTIKLRRDTINNYASHANHVPLKGEVCIVDPTTSSPWSKAKNIRIKIGDGIKTWAELPFLDEENYSVKRGYYYNDKFYSDVNHETEILPSIEVLYIDLHSGIIYYYDDLTAKFIANKIIIPNASSTEAGIMRLYTSLGYNEDGTMTQKAITEAIESIDLVVDEENAETLCLSRPTVE